MSDLAQPSKSPARLLLVLGDEGHDIRLNEASAGLIRQIAQDIPAKFFNQATKEPYTFWGHGLAYADGDGWRRHALRCEAVRCLVDKGASLSAREARGSTPLLRAVGCSMGTLVQLLLHLGAGPNERRQSTQRTAWDMANIPGWDVESLTFFGPFSCFKFLGFFTSKGILFVTGFCCR